MSKLRWIVSQIIFFTATVSAQMIYAPTDDPKDYPKALTREEKWAAQHPTYGFVLPHGATPQQAISAAETRLDWPNCLERFNDLTDAAKAALLIGQNARAKEFAERALQIPEEDRRHLFCPFGTTVF